MRTGEDDGVDTFAGKERRQDSPQPLRVRSATAQFGLGNLNQLRAADPHDSAVGGKFVDQLLGVEALHRAWCAQQANVPRAAVPRGRLDGRHDADHRLEEVGANARQHQRAGSIAGHDNDVGRHAVDQRLEHGINPDDQSFLRLGAIGKGFVVKGVDQLAAGYLAPNLVENAQTADTGIKDQNPGRMNAVGRAHGREFYNNSGPPGLPIARAPEQRLLRSNSARMRAMKFVIDQQQLIFFLGGLGVGLAFALLLALVVKLRGGRDRAELVANLQHALADSERQQFELRRTRADADTLARENAGLAATLDAERQRYREQVALLQQAREQLTREFENLANRIFEEKQASFSRQSRQAMDATVDPLRREIVEFRRKVEDVYEKENAERNRLAGQVIQLQKQAERIGADAIELANALKGGSKIQGNWGEVVLERILEQSGLRKGREYETQVSLRSDDGSRRNPDVILHLPDRRDIVIDAKVSLTDYERYCRADDNDSRQTCLKAHLASLRAHIAGLSRKAYEQLEGINTLDFVLIFVPVEPAFTLALEHDQSLFSDAYNQGIILVSPSTLLATLRTIGNIWRFEDQNRNAEKIAAQAGTIYDQFVLVAESLEDIGKAIDRSREAWHLTRRRLVQGRGNLVERLDNLKAMGARARRNMPEGLRLAALDEGVLDQAAGAAADRDLETADNEVSP